MCFGRLKLVNLVIVLYLFLGISESFAVRPGSLDIFELNTKDAFPEAQNCTTFDINCLEISLTDSETVSASSEKSRKYNYQCSLRSIKQNIFWWAFPNGSLAGRGTNEDDPISFLDLSYQQIGDDGIFQVVHEVFQTNGIEYVEVFSVAENKLTTVPFEVLSLVNNTLVYLSLRGNNFGYTPEETLSNETDGYLVPRLTFPKMMKLIGLDLSKCNINDLHEESFVNLTNLESLLLSHNRMIAIESKTFMHLPNLRHLDISNTEITPFNFTPHEVPTVEAYLNIFEGLNIAEDAFVFLNQLEYLDFSYTKLFRSSVKAFAHLSETVKYLSLCFTSIQIIGKGIFANTSLKAVDLSGNTYAAYHIGEESFEGIDDTLEFLAFEVSGIKSLKWLKNLRKLKVLKLGGNNINDLNNSTFMRLSDLQLLDLSSNHISNWFYRIFEQNTKLMVLNLRQNNINLITHEMLNDFSKLLYLAIGRNNFVCDCSLRSLIEVAATNNKAADCIRNIVQEGLRDDGNRVSIPLLEQQTAHDMFSGAVNLYRPLLEESHMNMLQRKKLYGIHINSDETDYSQVVCEQDRDSINKTFRFQLLDYTEGDYWCFNDSESLEVAQVTNCSDKTKSFDTDVEAAKRHLNVIIYASVFGSLSIFIVLMIYFRRWHLRYLYYTLKNSAVLRFYYKKKSAMNRDYPKFSYDIFVSYSDHDRDWVLQELLPNIDDTEQLTVCMHERDFQVGMTILENIISCMDKSRCVLLILSKHFLSSQWCLFELNLAQHRLLEKKRENLILILLEDIPKYKRPRTIQYLMEIKTYIKWPMSEKPDLSATVLEERKLFWKRLKKSLMEISFKDGRVARN